MNRHDIVACLKQLVDKHPVRRSIAIGNSLGRPSFASRSTALPPRARCARRRNRSTTAPLLVERRTARAACSHLPIDETCVGAEGPSRCPHPSAVYAAYGRGHSARSERRDSHWLSETKHTAVSRAGATSNGRTLTSASDGTVRECALGSRARPGMVDLRGRVVWISRRISAGRSIRCRSMSWLWIVSTETLLRLGRADLSPGRAELRPAPHPIDRHLPTIQSLRQLKQNVAEAWDADFAVVDRSGSLKAV